MPVSTWNEERPGRRPVKYSQEAGQHERTALMGNIRAMPERARRAVAPSRLGSLTRGARLKSQGNHGRKATGEAVATPSKGPYKTRSTPTRTAKPTTGGVAGTTTPPRTVTPEQRSKAWSYQKSRSRRVRSKEKEREGRRPKRLWPPNKVKLSMSKSRTRTCGKLRP